MTRTTLGYLGLPCLSALFFGCEPSKVITPTDGHCVNEGGNQWCVEQTLGTAPYCARGTEGCASDITSGCVATPPTPACYSPCGGRVTIADDPNQSCPEYPPTGSETSTSGATTSTTSDTTTFETTTTSTGATEATATTGSDGSSDGATDDASSGDSSTGTPGCLDDADCMPSLPYCDLASGQCLACSYAEDPDTTCETSTPETPLCVEDQCVPCTADDASACPETTPVCVDNACVECTVDDTSGCSDEAPACSTANLCVPCTETDPGFCGAQLQLCIDDACAPCTAHDQCPGDAPALDGAACDIQSGTCMPSEDFWHVDGDDCSPNGNGSPESPFCDLQEAVDAAIDAGQGTIILHELQQSEAPYLGSTIIDGAVRVAILAPPGEAPVLQGTGNAPALSIAGDTVVYLRDLSVSNGNAEGVVVADAFVHAENLRIAGNEDDGLRVSNATFEAQELTVTNNALGVFLGDGARLDASACRVIGNDGGGILVGEPPEPDSTTEDNQELQSGAPELRLTNCFVDAGVDANTITIYEGSAELLFTTLAITNLGDAHLLDCAPDSTVSIRNSALLSRVSELAICNEATISDSFQADNATSPPFSVDWFVDFASGDLHLEDPPSELLSAARWRSGDPIADIDGDLRPTEDDTPDVAGADMPSP